MAPTSSATPAVGEPPPPGERVFATALTDGGPTALLGVSGSTLWAAELDASGEPRVRWTRSGRGSVHLVASGDAGDGFALWVAWGWSRSERSAPIVLERLDGATGTGREVWRTSTARTEPASLAVVDVDRDRARDLAFSYFETNHAVRPRDLLGATVVREGEPVHMAASRAFGDLDGDGRVDEAIGQLYDVDPAKAGKLRVRLPDRVVDVPTSGGVRVVRAVQDGGRWALLVSDGWHKSYGKEARARVSLARWNGAAFETEPVATSPRDVSFFEVGAAAGPDGGLVVLARGDVTTLAVTRMGDAWVARDLPQLARSTSVALVDRGGAGPPLAFDARDPARGVPLPVER